MSYQGDSYYDQYGRPRKWDGQFERFGKPTPLKYRALYWMIFLVYMVLMVYPRWPYITKNFKESEKKCPSMEVAREKWGEMFNIQERGLKQIEQGKYTAVQFKKDVYRIAILRDETVQFDGAVGSGSGPGYSIPENLYDKFREGYIKNFDLTKSPLCHAWGMEECERRREEVALMGFEDNMRDAEAQVRAPGVHEANGEDLLRFAKKMLKAYLYFFPFALLIMILQFRQRKKKILEAIIVLPKSSISYMIFWPIGLLAFADEYNTEVRYRRAVNAYLVGKSAMYRLSPEEEAILRVQAERDIISFDIALEMVKKSPELIVRRSRFAAAVTTLIWALSTPMQFIQVVSACVGVAPKAKVVSVRGENPEPAQKIHQDPSDGRNDNSDGSVSVLSPKPEYGPEFTYFYRVPDTLGSQRIRRFLRQIQPRGPPRVEDRQAYLLLAERKRGTRDA
jgi:hypothetical protein